MPLQQQQLLYNGKEMRNAETLSGLGVADGDLVMMVSNSSSSTYVSYLLSFLQFVKIDDLRDDSKS